MEKRQKTGGRKSGSANQKTLDLREMLRKKFPKYDPIESLIKLSLSTADESIQKDCDKAVASYVYPKLRSIVHDVTTHKKVVKIIHLEGKETNAECPED